MLKKDLETALSAANRLIADHRESIEIAASTNAKSSKALQDEQAETRRLRKVLDRAITSADSRLATIHCEPPMQMHDHRQECCDVRPETTAIAEPSEEEKFLRFLVFNVLSDQYKPEEKDEFRRGFGY